MFGLMQDWPLTVDRLLDHAKAMHATRAVVTRGGDGVIRQTTYAELHGRAKRVSAALLAAGIRPGDRVGTLAWNTARHIEAWYGISGIGAICHTINPRLFPDQLAYIVNHAEDRILFADAGFAPLVRALLPHCPRLERVVLMSDAGAPAPPLPPPSGAYAGAIDYEAWIAPYPADAAWGGFDENTACGLCYTSGTTGDPKGVLYSHRSNFLHTLSSMQADAMGCSSRDSVLMIVPMFHANCWGLAYTAPAVGAKLVLPGPRLDGASLAELIEREGVTFSAAVPTVLQGLLAHFQSVGGAPACLKRIVVGGAACPGALIEGYYRYGIDLVHLWGMTEMSPMGSADGLTREETRLPIGAQLPTRLKQGRAAICVEMKITDEDGQRLPQDGVAAGNLKVRGPFVAGAYFKSDADILDAEGYFDTGDIATIDPLGRMQITDRAKDVIKSGGEWISSIEIENIAAGHPCAAVAAVIGLPHPKWTERPLLLIQLKPDSTACKADLIDFLSGKIARWQMPDDVLFVDQIPLGPTGKVDKKRLRVSYKDYVFPPDPADT
jgi:fatty-acyl-CoA synthase